MASRCRALGPSPLGIWAGLASACTNTPLARRGVCGQSRRVIKDCHHRHAAHMHVCHKRDTTTDRMPRRFLQPSPALMRPPRSRRTPRSPTSTGKAYAFNSRGWVAPHCDRGTPFYRRLKALPRDPRPVRPPRPVRGLPHKPCPDVVELDLRDGSPTWTLHDHLICGVQGIVQRDCAFSSRDWWPIRVQVLGTEKPCLG